MSLAKANCMAKILATKYKSKIISEEEYKKACIGLVKQLQKAQLTEKEWQMLYKHTNMKNFSKSVIKNRLISKNR